MATASSAADLDRSSFSYRLVTSWNDSPLWFALRVIFTVVCFTRILASLRTTSGRSDHAAGTRSIPKIPYWFPFVANALSFYYKDQSWLLDQARVHKSDVFALNLFGRQYIVLSTPELISNLPRSKLSSQQYELQKRKRFFGHSSPTSLTSTRIEACSRQLASGKRILARTIRFLEISTNDFISPSISWVEQAQWERTSQVTVLDEKPRLAISAIFPTLLRDFAAHIILSSILGSSFLDANPGFVSDLFDISEKYGTFMTGLPYTIAPGLGPAALKRERCLQTLETLVDAMLAEIRGESLQGKGVGMLYELDDVHPALWELIKSSNQEQDTNERNRSRQLACEVLECIWNITFEPVMTAIWMVFYLSMDGHNTLLMTVRDELEYAVQVIKPEPTGLPFDDPPKLHFMTDDILGTDSCSMIQGAFYEVLRLETEREEYLVVEDDFVLGTTTATNSEEEQRSVQKYEFKKGDHLYLARRAADKDSRRFEALGAFIPYRAKALDKDIRAAGFKGASKLCDSLCLSIVVAVLSFYEFKSLDGSQGLSHPGTMIVAGIGTPKRNMTVQVCRRALHDGSSSNEQNQQMV